MEALRETTKNFCVFYQADIKKIERKGESHALKTRRQPKHKIKRQNTAIRKRKEIT
jgi:hypothetical protein